ncbi:PqqD family protein [Okeania sp. SIO1I7]|uniref:PqqD family protein n=1 Tax=Okeania sp. SIO1I7 TaxID=2607772 RepID=UPI0013FC6B1B|nr:PqqD family protein [Okeania sp. SIO1I7]NET24093.1 PqqD family protein [Okeania sp. SIO1I7]
MIPVARSEKLLIQSVGNEVIVYDEVNNSSHCLNPMAARVWELCDGQHSVKDIAQLLEKELDVSQTEDVDMRGLVWLTLEELERYQLIKEYLKQPTGIASVSRRKVIKTGVLVGGFAVGSMFPVVKSIVAPAPVMAASQKCTCERSTVIVGMAIAADERTATIRARQNAKCKCKSPCTKTIKELTITVIKGTDFDRDNVPPGLLKVSVFIDCICKCP